MMEPKGMGEKDTALTKPPAWELDVANVSERKNTVRNENIHKGLILLMF